MIQTLRRKWAEIRETPIVISTRNVRLHDNQVVSSATMKVQIKQVVPLALLYAAEDNRISGRTRFQKLVFLTKEALEDSNFDLSPYEFIKYDYGPFSKELLDDLEMFERKGLVEIDENRTFSGNTRYDHRLTDSGAERFKELKQTESKVQDLYQIAEEQVEEYNSMPLRQLLEYIYDEYDEYKENSVYAY